MPQRPVDYLASAVVRFVGSAPSSAVEKWPGWLFDAWPWPPRRSIGREQHENDVDRCHTAASRRIGRELHLPRGAEEDLDRRRSADAATGAGAAVPFNPGDRTWHDCRRQPNGASYPRSGHFATP
jgi:hypothetical protein